MNTKRCPNCQKLLRAESAACSRCGYLFAGVSKRSPKSEFAGASRPARPDAAISIPGSRAIKRSLAGQRTIPPASPHRAGHYAGLHPEDQPYQSAMLPVPPPLAFQVATYPPAQDDVEPLPSPKTDPSIDDVPTYLLPRAVRERTPLPPVAPRSPGRKRVLPIILTLLCLFLLVVGSLTAYALMNKRSTANTLVLTAQPNQLRVDDALTLSGKGFGAGDPINFIHDGNHSLLNGNGKALQARADDLGTFAVQIAIPADWSVGLHSIDALDIGKDQSLSVGTTVTVRAVLARASIAGALGLASEPRRCRSRRGFLSRLSR